MIEPIPKLEPLISDLKDLSIDDFLESNDYKRFLIKAGLEESWRNAISQVKKNKTYFSVDLHFKYLNSIDALILILNQMFTRNREGFYHYVHDLLLAYTEWKQEDLNVKNIIEDLKILTPPKGIITKMEYLSNFFSKPVPKSDIPNNIWNADKLDSVIKKMDYSIQNQEYNLTVTYAYSCLEGLFKSYIKEQIPDKLDVDKLNQLAKIVRDNIIYRFEKEKHHYPEQMINLIPTITNAISNARNSYSDSHFDGESDKWTAEFARDCVNSIGRLILKLIK